MKKYSKSIEVKGENIKELFDCPIVTDIKKVSGDAYDGLDVDDKFLQVIAVDFSGNHKQVKRGSVLVMDVCEHWEIMTAEEWEEHKDDTITDPSSSDSADTSDTTDPDKGNGGSGTTDGDGGLLNS